MESPGTAPGSDPLITCAFMSIVRANPDASNIGGAIAGRKRGERRSPLVPPCGPIHPLGYFLNGESRSGAPGLHRFPNTQAAVPLARRLRGAGRQNPALIFSNSASCFSRCSGSFGVWARIGASTGDRPSFTAGSSLIVSIATVEVWP